MIVKLRTPISAHGEQRGEIDLREPLASDVNACGYPMRGLAGGGASPDPAVISALIARLGDIPPGSVGQLTMRDWNACMTEILSFFADAEETSSSDASTSPSSGNGIRAGRSS